MLADKQQPMTYFWLKSFPFFSNKMTFFFVKPDDECVPNREIYA